MISVKIVRNLFLMVSKSRCEVVEAKKQAQKLSIKFDQKS